VRGEKGVGIPCGRGGTEEPRGVRRELKEDSEAGAGEKKGSQAYDDFLKGGKSSSSAAGRGKRSVGLGRGEN